MNNAINNFVTKNQNQLIETILTSNDGTGEKTTGANLTLFKKVTIGDVVNGGTTLDAYLADKSYQFINQAGITSFVPSFITGSTFSFDNTSYQTTTATPSAIEQYNTRGIPQLITDNSRIPKTVFSSAAVNSVKYAEFTNARPENVGYTNFDLDATQVQNNFTIGSGNSIVTGGRYSTSCLNFQPSTNITRLLTKPATATNLIISFWLKDASAAGTIYLCVSSVAPGPTGCATTPLVSFTAGSTWKYYQAIVPFTTKKGGVTFYYSLGTSAAVKIDDVLMYPDNTGVSTYNYTTNSIGTNLLTAKTGVNGTGVTYEYDNAGRLWITRDQFDNILEVKKYKMTNRYQQQLSSINIYYSYTPYITGQTASFSAAPPPDYEKGDCSAPSISYVWDFGDGTGTYSNFPVDNNGMCSASHVYSNPGTYQVTVTAMSPGISNIVVQTPATSSTVPPPVRVASSSTCSAVGTPLICASGITQYTSAGQCILTSCSSLPSPTCNNTVFKLTDITGGSLANVTAVEWQVAPFGTNNWSTWQAETAISSGGDITSQGFNYLRTSSYIMRAKIRFCDNSIAYSNGINVKNGD
ncbi:MAG: PKD domain-containing protein [Bacteroidetes bacterium]|nr:PKD domain-containing protein [Bacteroidota bacterium]